jgi:hypothetical protein
MTLIGIGMASCSPESSMSSDDLSVSEIESPAHNRSSEPNLYKVSEDKVYLTWIEEDDIQAKLFMSELENDHWKSAKLIAQGDNWFVNWADFPSVTHFAKNSIAANFLVQSAPETYAYDVHLSISNDLGKNWGDSFIPHNDSTKTEHGFVSLVPWGTDLMAVWLDGRKYSTGQDEMTLRAALINKYGDVLEEYLLDDRVCDCCPTNAVQTDNGIVVVYRNRSQDEVRDISVVKFNGENWSSPQPIHEDNWEIAGCPVNGPAIDAQGQTIAIAWFTAAEDSSLVNVVFSEDGGHSFKNITTVSDAEPLGRVDVCMDKHQNTFVSWMEETKGETFIMFRRVNVDGSMSDPYPFSKTSASRTSGMPKMILVDDDILFAWTEVDDDGHKRIKTSTLSIPE